MSRIHPTAVIEPGARIADDVRIGAYCCIGREVELQSGVVLHSHVVIGGRTTVGAGTQIYPFASLGQPPQHQGYKGEPSQLIIGRDTVIREYVTMNTGTAAGGMATRVGDDCFFMMAAHVAHDCQVGDKVIMANNATLGGHVTVGDYAVVGGLSAVHQHVRIGPHVMIGGMSAVVDDVIPYGLAVGNRARLAGLNLVGLKRRGIPRSDILALRSAYRQIFAGEGGIAHRTEALAAAFAGNGPVMALIDFIRADAARPLCRPRSRDAA